MPGCSLELICWFDIRRCQVAPTPDIFGGVGRLGSPGGQLWMQEDSCMQVCSVIFNNKSSWFCLPVLLLCYNYPLQVLSIGGLEEFGLVRRS